MSSRAEKEAEEATDIFDEKIVDIMVMHVPITPRFNYYKIRPTVSSPYFTILAAKQSLLFLSLFLTQCLDLLQIIPHRILYILM